MNYIISLILFGITLTLSLTATTIDNSDERILSIAELEELIVGHAVISLDENGQAIFTDTYFRDGRYQFHGSEPWTTMSTYKILDNKICIGMKKDVRCKIFYFKDKSLYFTQEETKFTIKVFVRTIKLGD